MTLAVDASVSGTVSCALAAGAQRASLELHEGAAEALAGAVRRLTAAVGLDLRDVGRVVVGIGPGSFIGVRSAVTFANAVSSANGARVSTVVGLAAIAYEHVGGGETVAVAMEAGRGRSYLAAYRREGRALHAALAPATVDASDLGPRLAESGAQRLVVLDGVPPPDLEVPVVRLARRGPDAAIYLRLAEADAAVVDDAPAGAAALYLSPPVRR